MIYDKICTHCGKPFQSDKHYKKLCSKKCFCEVRKIGAQKRYDKMRQNSNDEREIVSIRITQPLDVYEHMCPKVGAVYTAEKVNNGQYVKQKIYIIRSIGKLGLVVRECECEEVSDKDVSV